MVDTFTLILIEILTIGATLTCWSSLLLYLHNQSFSYATRTTEGFPIYTPEHINSLIKNRYPLVS